MARWSIWIRLLFISTRSNDTDRQTVSAQRAESNRQKVFISAQSHQQQCAHSNTNAAAAAVTPPVTPAWWMRIGQAEVAAVEESQARIPVEKKLIPEAYNFLLKEELSVSWSNSLSRQYW
ncbi:hypothetical protein BJ878DRAFT_499769 [Calycina marina]|uniref:Uncharacterized protein n=1 Tax=Calycina marina TaxID=1763456 RepID=A0A9P8CG36_9HELO|nr:hypothetical protein BJ878DRAFT_499769 [Calycina marina]